MAYTRESFIAKAKQIHGDKYNYSKVDYKGYNQKVCIICPEHGEFWQTPIQHVSKHHHSGCPECGKQKSLSVAKTTEQFIQDAQKIYGDMYDYSKVNYINAHTKVCIICPEHGEFWIIPCNFLSGHKCPLCSKEKSIEERRKLFIENAKKVHGDKYDYSKVEYVDINTPVCIIYNGKEFYQKPCNHLDGHGYYEPIVYDDNYYLEQTKKYKTFYELWKDNSRLYYKLKQKNLLDKITWLEKTSWDLLKCRYVYVYEFDDNYAYVGVTTNIQRRHFQHKTMSKDSILLHAKTIGVDVPKPIVLEKDLTRAESQYKERYYIEKYMADGWNLLNKSKGGEGSIAVFEDKLNMTEKEIIDTCKSFKNAEEVYHKNRMLYNAIYKMKIQQKCFPNMRCKKMSKPHEYTEEFIKDIVVKNQVRKNLRKNNTEVYMYLQRHGRLTEYYNKDGSLKKI